MKSADLDMRQLTLFNQIITLWLVGSMDSQKFYGKYRGKVTDNRDPEGLGRIRALVPDVIGDEEIGWALPSAPYAGDGVGFLFIPPIGANVWIEFEKGNPDNPIWVGCFWDRGQTPKIPANPDVKLIKTDSVIITINDVSKSVGINTERIEIIRRQGN
jgi:hypothetical protein